MTTTLTFPLGQLNFGDWPSMSAAPALTLPPLVPTTGTVTFAALGAHASTSTPDEVDEWASWEERFLSLLPRSLLRRYTVIDAAGAIAGWFDASPAVTWVSLGEDETWRLEVASPAGWARGFLATQLTSKLVPYSATAQEVSATVSYYVPSSAPAMSCWSFTTEPSKADGIVIEEVLEDADSLAPDGDEELYLDHLQMAPDPEKTSRIALRVGGELQFRTGADDFVLEHDEE